MGCMMVWPADCDAGTLEQALRIAVGYLVQTGQIGKQAQVDAVAEHIVNSWRSGMRHPLRLANAAIAVVESDKKVVDLPSTKKHAPR